MSSTTTFHRRSRVRLALAAAALLHALAAVPVQAAPLPAASGPASSPAAALPDAGTWTLSKDGEGAPACRVKLERRRVIGGSAISASPRCSGVTARAEDLYAWHRNPAGELVMSDPQRHAVLVFHALPNGVWATGESDEDRLLLQRVRGR
ncbi:AprI/Inh family metalloprotease inhibitor [Piscinibacter terrae]|uniref:Alkaline proteinase inhibitor/ Outer membrane lipoprotein Omp19 domain-containing protein n=1 Tax=Piscinibacter terrae TaxID=2496871 RepID=A0A3N7HVQ9_9BURK|nr:AprI/Inh family metalloprotease inhibitor [Albitalea terrae]RQP26468.1 hypothetical protein DZC73_05530 [Albitalea terrae]